jgi:hypothetical protein
MIAFDCSSTGDLVVSSQFAELEWCGCHDCHIYGWISFDFSLFVISLSWILRRWWWKYSRKNVICACLLNRLCFYRCYYCYRPLQENWLICKMDCYNVCSTFNQIFLAKSGIFISRNPITLLSVSKSSCRCVMYTTSQLPMKSVAQLKSYRE